MLHTLFLGTFIARRLREFSKGDRKVDKGKNQLYYVVT